MSYRIEKVKNLSINFFSLFCTPELYYVEFDITGIISYLFLPGDQEELNLSLQFMNYFYSHFFTLHSHIAILCLSSR